MPAQAPTYRLFVVAAALSATLALGACGGDDEAKEAPRPVLVVHPGAGDALPFAAFAGDIRAREESPLSFRVGGQILRRFVDAGDRVKQGQVLAELDARDLRAQSDAAQAQAAAADAELARASAERKRLESLVKDQLVSRSAYDAQQAAYASAAGQARAARSQFEVARNQAAYTQLRAPRDGVIATRSAEAGQTVTSGQAVYTLAGAGGREVAIALPESRIREFQVGQPVLVELWSQPGERLPGRIREISAAADPQARTYATRIELDPRAAQAVELGQSARVFVAGARSADSTLRVPLSALQRNKTGATAVWVVDPVKRTLHLTPVRIGPYGEDTVTVLSGVRANDWVVSAGGHLLREGQSVAPVDRDNRPVATATPQAR
jgi:multidrug efflux system membrane fusion protein